MPLTYHYKIKFFLLLLFLSSSASVFSQNENTIISVKTPEEFLQAKINFGTKVLEKGGYLDIFRIYESVRTEDISLCEDNFSKNMAEDLIKLRYSGENRCDEINNVSARQLCEIANSSDCGRYTGWKNGFCQAVRSSDYDILNKIINKNKIVLKNILSDFPTDKKSILFGFGIYQGFKYYNPLGCERFVKKSDVTLSWKLSCRMLFYPDYNKEKERVVKDLSLFVAARSIPEPALCEEIDQPTLKNSCLTGEPQHLSEIW